MIENHNYINDCLMPFGIYVAAYFIFCTPFTIIDLLGCPEPFRKYKVQPNENLSISFNQIKKCSYVVLFNLIVIGLPSESLLYLVRVWRGCHNSNAETGLSWFITSNIQMLIMTPLFSIIFYYVHYCLHLPRIYKYVHKVHHEWKAPISLSNYYAHPFDYFLATWFDIAIPPLIVGADSTTITIWYVTVVFMQTCIHSGYKLPLFPDPEFHDYHHANFTKNYGTSGLPGLNFYLDKLHGTLAVEKKD